ncbi:hypothetical protein [Chromobacterium haemolyticum]|uniref:hypothetical protein n=1 Tax=Chromobacterium haemolyticum TaxID=394935 RepID=UPI0024491D61|nr:hypothetical protein [Chromobacterium haemolyticum]MDH0342020.1 hypothetical protein [Chromobacterium haemolyticum]
MPYTLTPADLASITGPEMAFSTERLLPAWDDIPDEFKKGNDYTALVEALFYGTNLPDCGMEFLPGFEESAADLNKCVRAHLQSFGPKHEHKIAGVGYMVSLVCVLHPANKTVTG